MKEKLRNFMVGRYGPDQYGHFLSIVTIVLMVLGIFFGSVFPTLGLAALIYSYFRIFSRNVSKRAEENQAYLRIRQQVTHWFQTRRQRFANRDSYRYFRCPACKQDVRIPKGQGEVTITCPKCATKFEKKS